MRRIYIAGKIGDLPENVYKLNFEIAKSEVEIAGFIPVSPVDLPHEHERTWKAYMLEDLAALKTCQGVYMLRNWNDSRGARIERWVAMRLGIQVYYQSPGDGSPGIYQTASFSLLSDIQNKES